MSNPDRTSPPSPPIGSARRRSSFAGQFVDLFGRTSSTAAPTASSGVNSGSMAGSITEAAAQAQRRRLSLTTIGLSGSPNQSSPFSPGRPRTESISSANSGSVDESPFEDSDGPSGSSSVPPTPFGRRLSFGARALRDVRTGSVGGGSGNGNPRPSVSKTRTPPTAKRHGRGLSSFGSLRSDDVSESGSLTGSSVTAGGGGGFDFAENFRSRAERSSVSAASGAAGPPLAPPPHQRAKSVASEQPIQAVPKQPKVPDAIQERMLRGDFYMD